MYRTSISYTRGMFVCLRACVRAYCIETRCACIEEFLTGRNGRCPGPMRQFSSC